MRLETLKRLDDARSACVLVAEFIQGKSKAEFIASPLVRAAVERQVEIIGESLGKAAAEEPEVEQSLPQLRKIVGMHNRLVPCQSFSVHNLGLSGFPAIPARVAAN